MGLGPSLFYIYSRDQKSGRYNEEHLEFLRNETQMTERHALGVFKREVYALALGEEYRGDKAIYLYADSYRLARAGFDPGDRDKVVILFRDAKTKHTWMMSEEKLIERRWPLLERKFERQWNAIDAGTLTVVYARQADI